MTKSLRLPIFPVTLVAGVFAGAIVTMWLTQMPELPARNQSVVSAAAGVGRRAPNAHLDTGLQRNEVEAATLMAASRAAPRAAGAFTRATTLRLQSNPVVRHFNWRAVVGVWWASILLVLAVTGVTLSLLRAKRLLSVEAAMPLGTLRAAATSAEKQGGELRCGVRPSLPDFRHLDQWSFAVERRIST